MDYLRFYQTTGRPPPPCPDEPSSDTLRAALGLPPRFTPWKDPTAPLPTQQPMPHVPIPPPIGSMFDPTTNYSPERLAQIQVHVPLRVGHEVYENISCAHKFAWYSVEELRYFAYRQGLKYAPAPVPTPPLPDAVPTTNGSSSTPTVIISGEGDETLEHISTNPAFSRHSPEELRLAFIRTGRELNSQQLLNV